MMMHNIFGDNLLDDLFEGITKPISELSKLAPATVMKTDIKELESEYELVIDLPGVQKEDVKAEVKDGYLIVSATHGSTTEEKDQEGKYIRKERYYGTASRKYYIGDQVTKDDIKGRFENGILKLIVPKPEKKQPEKEDNFINIE